MTNKLAMKDGLWMKGSVRKLLGLAMVATMILAGESQSSFAGMTEQSANQKQASFQRVQHALNHPTKSRIDRAFA